MLNGWILVHHTQSRIEKKGIIILKESYTMAEEHDSLFIQLWETNICIEMGSTVVVMLDVLNLD